VLAPSAIAERRPDVVVVLPWNIEAEVREVLAGLGFEGEVVTRRTLRDERPVAVA
jgi:hypothetical protein